MICWRLGLRVNALDGQAADTDARERGQRQRVACFHEIDPRCGGWTFDRETSLKFLRHNDANFGIGTLGQSGLRQAFDDTLKISGVLVRQDALALRQREAWIDLEKPRPCRARVVRAPEMAVA